PGRRSNLVNRAHPRIVGPSTQSRRGQMAVRLHRCSWEGVKIGGHPWWRVEKALHDTGPRDELVPDPQSRRHGDVSAAGTGQRKYQAVEFEDGSWYREESKDMERTIREGHLMEKASSVAPAEGGEETA